MRKPVLIYKGGQTEQGAKTAFSHTGAMSSGYQLWEKMARQFGVILVDSLEEMHDFIKLYRLIQPPNGSKIRDGDFWWRQQRGLCGHLCQTGCVELPDLAERTQKALLEFIPPMGTIIRNPVDVSAGGWDPHAIEKTLGTVGKDPSIDAVVFVPQIGFVAVVPVDSESIPNNS